MQQIHVVHVPERIAQALEAVASLQQGHVERLAVEGDDRVVLGQSLGQCIQHGVLFVEVAHEVQLHAESAVLDHSDADQERARASTAGQAGRLGIEEYPAIGVGRAQLLADNVVHGMARQVLQAADLHAAVRPLVGVEMLPQQESS